MSGGWFETVAQAQVAAKRRLPKPVYQAILAGTEAGYSYRDNIQAFEEIGLVPTLVGAEVSTDLSTRIMDVDCSMPVLLSPTGVQAVHPEGEVAVARAGRERDVIVGLSSFASRPVEQVAEANPNFFYQMYWMQSKEDMLRWISRARRAGAKGLILTLDWSFSHGRDWGSPHIPDRVTFKEALRFAPHTIGRLSWLKDFLASGGVPTLGVPNVSDSEGVTPTFFGAYGSWMGTPRPTWDDIAWLRDQWQGSFMLKGVWNPKDAERAIAAGVSAISVSNHGGNNLDGVPSPMRILPKIVEAVAGRAQILLDGGVRRGSDVVKARALGADAVMVGRPYLWGLAANGSAGVVNVIDILGQGIVSTLRGMGKPSLSDLKPSDLLIPEGFFREPQDIHAPID